MSRTHGKVSTYIWGCRCDECRAAKNAYQREWWRRKHPPRTREAPTERTPTPCPRCAEPVMAEGALLWCDRCAWNSADDDERHKTQAGRQVSA